MPVLNKQSLFKLEVDIPGMRIIIGCDNYFPNVNGASIFTQRLAFYLQKRNHEILVIAPGRDLLTKETVIDGINVLGLGSVPIFVYKDFRWTPSFVGRYDLKRVVKSFRPDVIHIQDHFYIGASLARIAKNLGVPSVGTNHFMPENLTHYLHLPETGEKVVANIGWRHFCSVYGLLDIVTTPTETAAKLLDNVRLNKPVFAISCGIDRDKFNPSISGDFLREKYKFPKLPTLLYVGRLDREKKVDLLLKAFHATAKKVASHFIVAGKGAEERNLKEIADKLGLSNKVTFTGFVADADLPALYRAADCFVIAGIAELQSIVTMEAMASGLPVIAVNAMALPELARHERNGYLFEPDDTDMLSKYMQNILSNKALREKMSKNSLEIIENHDINRAITQYEQIYARLKKRDSRG